MRAAQLASASIRPSIVVWVLVLGSVGLAVGFFAPIALNPEANTGPLIGILITGPRAAMAGLILGALFRVLPVGNARRLQALILASVVALVSALYVSLPEPALEGYVIDAEVAACASPTDGIDAAIAEWEQAVARVTWATPPADWKDTAVRTVERDPGVVLTMRIQRKSAIFRHRKPWDRRRMSAGPWMTVDESKRFYERDDGRSCQPYLARGREIYWPVIDPDSNPPRPAPVWPPTDALGFLELQALGPVPPEYQRLLDGQ